MPRLKCKETWNSITQPQQKNFSLVLYERPCLLVWSSEGRQLVAAISKLSACHLPGYYNPSCYSFFFLLGWKECQALQWSNTHPLDSVLPDWSLGKHSEYWLRASVTTQCLTALGALASSSHPMALSMQKCRVDAYCKWLQLAANRSFLSICFLSSKVQLLFHKLFRRVFLLAEPFACVATIPFWLKRFVIDMITTFDLSDLL